MTTHGDATLTRDEVARVCKALHGMAGAHQRLLVAAHLMANGKCTVEELQSVATASTERFVSAMALVHAAFGMDL